MITYFVYLLVVTSFTPIGASPKLIIDHDAGADDAMAIFLALLYEKYFNGPTVVGLTTTHGNADEPQVFINTQKILDIAQRRDIPIYRGCNSSLVMTYPSDDFFGSDAFGDVPDVEYQPIEAQSKHAANALIDLSKQYEGELILVALGALTNIALAIRLDPGFIGRLGHVYAAAGKINDIKNPKPDYNSLMDVEAYYVFVQNSSPDKVSMIFSNLLDRSITMQWRQEVLGAIDTPIMKAQNQFERKADTRTPYWRLLDPQAMALVLNKTLINHYRCSNNSIVLCGKYRSMNIDNFASCKDSNVKIAYAKPKDEITSFLYNVFSAQLKK